MQSPLIWLLTARQRRGSCGALRTDSILPATSGTAVRSIGATARASATIAAQRASEAQACRHGQPEQPNHGASAGLQGVWQTSCTSRLRSRQPQNRAFPLTVADFCASASSTARLSATPAATASLSNSSVSGPGATPRARWSSVKLMSLQTPTDRTSASAHSLILSGSCPHRNRPRQWLRSRPSRLASRQSHEDGQGLLRPRS